MPPISAKKLDFEITVVSQGNVQKRKPTAASLGVHVRGAYRHTMDPSDPLTMVAGLEARVARAPPVCREDLMVELETFVSEWLRANLLPFGELEDISTETWLQGAPYSKARKLELMKAYETTFLSTTRKDARVDFHVKNETFAARKHARIINSRSDNFKVRFGPIIHAVEQIIFSRPEFIKKSASMSEARIYHESFVKQ